MLHAYRHISVVITKWIILLWLGTSSAVSLLMLVLPRALLVQQLCKLGATQSSAFGVWKAALPTETEALPGNSCSVSLNAMRCVLC